jgi:LmbE family N-acetylglucosaminyl deacetylase
VLALTDGEAACPEVPDLAQIRRDELDGAMAALGVDTVRVMRWGLPDGHLEAHESQITAALLEVGSHFGLLVAPFERDGRPDHEAAARAARSAAATLHKPLARYPIWAWHRGSRELQGAPSAVRLLLDEEACAAKYLAHSKFRSQGCERPGGPIVPEHVLAYFRVDCEVFLL